MSYHYLKQLAFAAIPLAAAGCTQGTTSEDVSEARQDVAAEQQDVEEVRREVMKPTIGDEAAEDVQEEQQDVVAAQANLNTEELKLSATQARDAFAMTAQNSLDNADRQIEALETRASNEEGAVVAATQVQIDDLKSRRERLSDAVDDLKSEELLKWDVHRTAVQRAMDDLNLKMTTDIR